MRWMAGIAAMAMLAGSAMLVRADDWPQFRGAHADGLSAETLGNKDWKAQPPKVLWTITLGDKGYAGASVADGKLFIIDHAGKQDIVRAIDVNSGQDVWRFAYDDTDKANYGFARSTPTFDDGKLYTLSRLGWLHCLDARTGQKLWARDIIADFAGQRPKWDLAGSPLIDGPNLIVSPGGKNVLAALNKQTGQTVWTGGGQGVPGYSTPVVATIDGVRQYVLFTASDVIGVDAASGQLLWTYPWKTDWDVNATQPIVMGNTVFISTGYKHGCALLEISARQVRVLWQNKQLQQHFNSAILFRNHLYGTTDPGDVICLDPLNGQALWRQSGFEKGGLIGVDGTMIVVDGKNGDVVLASLDPAGYQELGRIKPLGGQSWTQPILSNGKLFVRNTQGLACVDVK